MDSGMEKELVMKALQMALQVRKPTEGLLHHSDRGSQADPMSSHRQVCTPGRIIRSYLTLIK
jgi:transposase InsO family protein